MGAIILNVLGIPAFEAIVYGLAAIGIMAIIRYTIL